MKSSINDLNTYLFTALDRIMDSSLSGEDLDREIRRAETVTDVANTLIHSGELQLKAMRHGEEYGYFNTKNRVMPMLLSNDEENAS